MGTDEQINAARRELTGVISRTHAYVSHAAELLEGKAKRSPGTAEATAHAMMLKAKWDLDGWLRRSAELVGVALVEEVREAVKAAEATRPAQGV